MGGLHPAATHLLLHPYCTPTAPYCTPCTPAPLTPPYTLLPTPPTPPYPPYTSYTPRTSSILKVALHRYHASTLSSYVPYPSLHPPKHPLRWRCIAAMPAGSPWLVSDFGSRRPVGARERSGPHPEGPWGVPNGSCPSGAQMSTGIGLLRAAQPRR